MKLECSKCGGLRFVAQTAWVHVLNHDGTYMYQLDPRDKEYDKLFNAETIKHNIYCAKCGELVHIGDDGDIDADLPIINKFKKDTIEV